MPATAGVPRGNCRTCLLACVSASDADVRGTFKTLRFAQELRSVTQVVQPNLVPHRIDFTAGAKPGQDDGGGRPLMLPAVSEDELSMAKDGPECGLDETDVKEETSTSPRGQADAAAPRAVTVAAGAKPGTRRWRWISVVATGHHRSVSCLLMRVFNY
jgi:hypothetical protein